MQSLRLVEPISYVGVEGVLVVRGFQQELNDALEKQDWNRVRKLDQRCVMLIDKVIAANKDNPLAISEALNELKDVYASLIVQCKQEVASMAH